MMRETKEIRKRCSPGLATEARPQGINDRRDQWIIARNNPELPRLTHRRSKNASLGEGLRNLKPITWTLTCAGLAVRPVEPELAEYYAQPGTNESACTPSLRLRGLELRGLEKEMPSDSGICFRSLLTILISLRAFVPTRSLRQEPCLAPVADHLSCKVWRNKDPTPTGTRTES